MPSSASSFALNGLCCPIMGMHRSGTSCLARILNAAGMEMGENLSLETHLDNLVGHWEPLDMNRINNRILAISGGSWTRVPKTLTADDEVKAEIQAFLERFRGSPVVGWKDPRMTVTFPVWRPYLSNYQLVASVRHPHAVANSLKERNDIDFEDGVRLWADYNERLLQYVDEVPRIFWFHYDGSPEVYASSLKSFCESAGLRFSADLMKLFNPCLTHQTSAADVADPRARKLYQRLMELSQSDLKNGSHGAAIPREGDDRAAGSCPSSPAPGWQHASTSAYQTLDEQRVQIAQVVEALRSISLHQQRDQKALRTAIDCIHSLENRLQLTTQSTAQLSARMAAQLSEELQPLALRLEAVEQSAILRVPRAVSAFIRKRFAHRPNRTVVAEQHT